MPKRNNYVRFDACYLCKITQQDFGISKRSSPKTNRGDKKKFDTGTAYLWQNRENAANIFPGYGNRLLYMM